MQTDEQKKIAGVCKKVRERNEAEKAQRNQRGKSFKEKLREMQTNR
jgi:hypothetical protein